MMIPLPHNPVRSARSAFLQAAWIAALASSGCVVPDSPADPDPPLPAAAVDWLAPDSLRGRTVSDGVSYHFAWSARGPWALHMVAADLNRCELELVVVPALAEDGRTRTRETVTAMVPNGRVTALAGVNGDFFAPGGAPVGPEVTSATQRSSTRPGIAWDAQRIPRIGPGAARNDSAPRRLQVVGGFPELLDGGIRVGDLQVGDRPDFAAARHPRTAVGFDPGSGVLWLVVVDGRQLPRSAGMALPELTELLLALGVAEALNLDGGGSSVMTVAGETVSRPSDAAGERPVGNSLWLVRDGSACEGDQRGSAADSQATDRPT
ncbi:MAG: phosphodiester glycosidase family protein [Gemmatimonadetes bacterium]|nr:phosphodiester glycosidase family protein [Gemmatimonadota bacterium]MYB97221.1 phosphodiester glycosidase family protein [Gemmatimonadota bacterium]MYI45261.1 phosphodiester glycosidase family protein [Gemmatimonadota bacterium]